MSELHMSIGEVEALTRTQFEGLMQVLIDRSAEADPKRKNAQRQRVSTPEEAKAAIAKLRAEGFA